ncbi:putative membrane protein YccC [Tardiphaga robiniae]|uniref:FUSC family protein n=1 Tax=Tardiphaga robiniae TaxID=943830 RepID=UPI00285DCC1D|nr:FUSC family protein [Tardiphaga robiniae]MDR6661296.1 putative membrane protein YccC [Tardiphaga robiniae]
MHQTIARVAPVEPRAPTIAGFSVASWSFALRIWLATLLALYASFWLELEVPSTAAISVAILALPTRGQGLDKASFRLVATAVGVAASIAIAGIFSQTGGLLLAVYGVWIGLCVFAAAMFDGNRAYAAALCCITVALIAIQQIDSPQLVFPTGVARGAAIAVGVLALALVNDTLAAPDYHPILTGRLEFLHQQVADYVERVLRGERIAAMTTAAVLRDIAAVRPELTGLATESSSGLARHAAASTVLVDLADAVSLARSYETLSAADPAIVNGSGKDSAAVCRTWITESLRRNGVDISNSLDALRTGTYPARHWQAPLYRSGSIAVESGVRAALQFTLVAALFVIAGWPSTEISISLVAVIIGLGATSPDPRMFTLIAVVATPIACVVSGILRYFVFNGVSDFLLLAIGLAPVVIGLALLISLPNGLLSALGRLTLVFTLAILAPANPQSYDPQIYVLTCFFAFLSAVLVFAAQTLISPSNSDRRLRLLLREARRELHTMDVDQSSSLTTAEAIFRDATRIGQIVAAKGVSASDDRRIQEAMRYFDEAATLQRSRAELQRLPSGALIQPVNDALSALASRNGRAIVEAALTLREAAAQQRIAASSAYAALVLSGVTFAFEQPASIATEAR